MVKNKNSIREHINFYVCFKLTNKNEDITCRDLFTNIMDKELFYEECKECWRKKHCYIALNKDKESVFDNIVENPIEYEWTLIVNEWIEQMNDFKRIEFLNIVST